MKKSESMPVDSAKWFCPRIFAQFAKAGNGIAKPNKRLPKKSPNRDMTGYPSSVVSLLSLCSSRREGADTLHLRLTVSEGHGYPLVKI
jgi:hypothetical protein